MNWLKARWNEPESRAAAAGAVTAVSARVGNQIDTPTLLYSLIGFLLMFLFPGFKPPA